MLKVGQNIEPMEFEASRQQLWCMCFRTVAPFPIKDLELVERRVQATERKRKSSQLKMLSTTKAMLKAFHGNLNTKLAELLEDDQFTWPELATPEIETDYQQQVCHLYLGLLDTLYFCIFPILHSLPIQCIGRDYSLSVFRPFVLVFVNRLVVERLRRQFFTDFHQILHAEIWSVRNWILEVHEFRNLQFSGSGRNVCQRIDKKLRME